jgi:hypothetical protein
MSSGSSGRPKGTQNRPGHSAGGSRIGAGRKRKARIDSSSPEPSEVAESAGASSSTAPAEAGPGELSQSHLSVVIDDLSWGFRPQSTYILWWLRLRLEQWQFQGPLVNDISKWVESVFTFSRQGIYSSAGQRPQPQSNKHARPLDPSHPDFSGEPTDYSNEGEPRGIYFSNDSWLIKSI